MSSITPKKPASAVPYTPNQSTSAVACTPKKVKKEYSTWNPHPLPNDNIAVANSAEAYRKVLTGLEGLLDVHDEVKEVLEILTSRHRRRLDSGVSFISKQEREDAETNFLSKRVTYPLTSAPEEHVIASARNTRSDSVRTRIRRLEAVDEAVRKTRVHIRLIRHHVRAYQKYVPDACGTGESQGCCWNYGEVSQGDISDDDGGEEEPQDMTKWMHQNVFRAREAYWRAKKEEQQDGSDVGHSDSDNGSDSD
ncbi:hypothetical protein V5O48_009048 [Marasmius crinis-equi]|uniref:Uncharacterized protein n=1 Tax=Marasmius crinis-equi TaxID=585013 RepID=A0ABR3FCD7_9AGAR